MTVSPPVARKISVVIFDQFELLDVCGPVELFSHVPHLDIEIVGPAKSLVPSSQGVELKAHSAYSSLENVDILLIPGGAGTRALAEDTQFLTWLRDVAASARIIASVCTGSALLAAAGVLDGHSATSNKRAYSWATAFGPNVNWHAKARWVQDGNRWTSSGVAAGMDMTAALIAHEWGTEIAEQIGQFVEYEPQKDPSADPFASLYGLT